MSPSNTYVHPVLSSALREVAGLDYSSGDISDPFLDRKKADGVGRMVTADKLPLVYVEGSGPSPNKAKEEADAEKVAGMMVKILERTVGALVEGRRRVPVGLATFGVQSVGMEVRFFMLDYHEEHLLLHEIDSARVPREASEMPLFVDFYEAVLKWAFVVQQIVRSFDDSRIAKRPSRKSHIHGMQALFSDDS
ncbi:hypothetical protein HDV00_000636 [Rhizophlyctis rosea]|nr:hypothetical protein HDV00_000636 [Rhizophlyctis rosea]